MSVNMFEAGSAARRSQEEEGAPLVSFRAGKCGLEGTRVTPLAGKGRVDVFVDGDGVLHLTWTERGEAGGEDGRVVDDLVILPGDATFSKIGACTDGRVYLLRFSSGRKLLFWMQEVDATADAELFTRVNQILANPPQPPSAAAPVDQDTIRHLLGAVSSGTATPAERAQLQRIMVETQARRAAAARGGGGGGGGARPPPRPSQAEAEAEMRRALQASLAEAQAGAPGGFGGFGGDDAAMDEEAMLQAAIQASIEEAEAAAAAGGNGEGGEGSEGEEQEDGAVEDIDDDAEPDADLYR